VAALVAAVGVSAASIAVASAAPRATPTISSFTATPDQLQAKGGSVFLAAEETNASTCTFSSNTAIKDLPETIPCPHGHPSITVTVPANTTNNVEDISFTMKANGSGGAYAEATLFVHVEPPPAAITSFTASTTHLPKGGGPVTLSGKVVRGNECVITSDPALKGQLPYSASCTSGTVSKTVTLPATTSGTQVEYVFELEAQGLGGSPASEQVDVYVAAQDATVTDFTASPTTLPAAGGTVTLTAKVTDAVGCNYGDSWKGGDPKGTNPASNLPASIKCTSGTVTFKVTVIADKSKLGETITFLMTANSQAGVTDATQEPVVTQAAA
jgi:hypothetical protein